MFDYNNEEEKFYIKNLDTDEKFDSRSQEDLKKIEAECLAK